MKMKKYYNLNDLGNYVSEPLDPCQLCIIGGDCRKCDCFETRDYGNVGTFDEAFFVPVAKLVAIKKVESW